MWLRLMRALHLLRGGMWLDGMSWIRPNLGLVTPAPPPSPSSYSQPQRSATKPGLSRAAAPGNEHIRVKEKSGSFTARCHNTQTQTDRRSRNKQLKTTSFQFKCYYSFGGDKKNKVCVNSEGREVSSCGSKPPTDDF